MTVKGSGVIFLLVLLFSCTDRQSVPKDIIIPDSMEVIMNDLIVADQFVSQYLLKDSLKRDVKKESQDLYDKVFAVHGTTRAVFRKSLAYYSARPDQERLIFDSLASQATRDRTALYKEKYGVRDSLAKKSADSLALIRNGPPPLNPDSLKKMISKAHPALSPALVQDSVNIRLKIRAGEDSVRRATQIRDSTIRHKADSIRMRKITDSLQKHRGKTGNPFHPKAPGQKPVAPVP